MARAKQDITDAELSVMELLWESGPCTIRDLASRLYTDVGRSEHATIQKLLDRHEEKKCVSRDRSGTAHVYQAQVDRDEVIGRSLRSVAEKLCGGSVTPLLTHLVRAQNLSPQERRELRDLIDELDDESGKSSK